MTKDVKKRVKMMQALIDQGWSLSYAKSKADNYHEIDIKKDRIAHFTSYIKLKREYKKKIKLQRSFHKCID